MKSLLGFTVFALCSSFIFGAKTLLPKDTFSLDKPDDVLFQEFQNKFNVKLAKTAEKTQRFKIFSQNLVKIRALNALNNGVTYGINEFSDISPEEFKQRLLSDEFMVPKNLPAVSDEDANSHGDWWQDEHRRTRRDVYPVNFDWRTQNVVSPIRDQGSCGSCWAFASVAAVEAHYAIKNNGAKIELSEQELVDCDKRSYGCNGGFMYEALEYIRDKGLHSRTNYPYTGWGNTCQANKTGTKTKIADAYYILPNNETTVRNVVFNKGPVIMGFVFPYSLQYYVSGIFTLTWEECRAQKNGNHAMTIVGYGEENGKKYWIAKNSWGSWWGENGFVRFERDIQFCRMVADFYLFAPSFDAPTTTTSTTTTTTTPVPTTATTTTPPTKSLNCSGAMDLVFVIDVSNTMTEERLEVVKSQLVNAITQNGIKWMANNNDTARVGIILTAGLYSVDRAVPRRYVDFRGYQRDFFQSPKYIIATQQLKQAIRDIVYDDGVNDIGLSMNFSINGDSAFPEENYPAFGDPIFGGLGDRPNVANAMIVITGADTSNPTIPSTLLRNFNVDIYSIGFEDVSMAQLQAISGNPAKAFSTTPVNLANTISNICAGYLNEVPTTTTLSTATTTSKLPATTTTTAVPPKPLVPLNCSGAMDLVFVIDVSNTMTEERLEVVKSQLVNAITQNGIKWMVNNNDTARVGIILTAGLYSVDRAVPRRYVDFRGYQRDFFQSPKYIIATQQLKQAIRDIVYDDGVNDIGLSMNFSINGDSAFPEANYPAFGDPIFGGLGDRPNVANAMIVITGADTSNPTIPSTLLRNFNVDIYSIGFEDVSMTHLQAISGNPAKAFSTTPVNLANTISNICAGFLNE